MPIPAPIQQFIDGLIKDAPTSYGDLRAVIFNGTLKRSPEPSQTDGLLSISLKRELPESKKPRQIAISGAAQSIEDKSVN